MTNNTSKLPTHRAYAVTKKGDKAFWREIGAAWAHGDGEGLSLKLDYLPLKNQPLSSMPSAQQASRQQPFSIGFREDSLMTPRRATNAKHGERAARVGVHRGGRVSR
jgi:hypothetical protein